MTKNTNGSQAPKTENPLASAKPRPQTIHTNAESDSKVDIIKSTPEKSPKK